MAKIIDNPNGRRMIKLSADDVFMIISMYQQRCSSKAYTHEEARVLLNSNKFYIPEEV